VIRAAAVVLMLGGCFAPKLDPCSLRCGPACPEGYACGVDGFCHAEGESASCAGGDAGIDAALADARPRPDGSFVIPDAPPPTFDAAPVNDAPPTPDAARPDAPIALDAAPPPDARPPVDAAPGPPDARDCSVTCGAERACGTIDGCACGGCFDETWCGDLCVFAVCEASRCCLPETSLCSDSTQCCAGMVCVTFCVAL
jgi:hypothetical protein